MSCPLCNGKYKYFSPYGYYIYVAEYKGRKVLKIGERDRSNTVCFINYCPDCGEKFKKGEEE